MAIIKKIIGLEGPENSGKSHILKNLVKRLSKGVNVVIYDYKGDVLPNFPKNGDYIALFDYKNKYIAVATGGDYSNNVNDVKNAVNKNNKDVDVLVAAMRDVKPDVKSRYEEFARTNGIPFDTIFKPGFKRMYDPNFAPKAMGAEDYWVKDLISRI